MAALVMFNATDLSVRSQVRLDAVAGELNERP